MNDTGDSLREMGMHSGEREVACFFASYKIQDKPENNLTREKDLTF